MPKRKGQRKKALAQPKKKRKYAVARGCATFKSPPPAKECPEDDEPIALAASKWKKHKAAQKKKNNPIQDLSHLKENESNDEENQPTIDDIAKKMNLPVMTKVKTNHWLKAKQQWRLKAKQWGPIAKNLPMPLRKALLLTLRPIHISTALRYQTTR
jgi:hypothetical protein